MSTMHLPGFTAEWSLAGAGQSYRAEFSGCPALSERRVTPALSRWSCALWCGVCEGSSYGPACWHCRNCDLLGWQ